MKFRSDEIFPCERQDLTVEIVDGGCKKQERAYDPPPIGLFCSHGNGRSYFHGILIKYSEASEAKEGLRVVIRYILNHLLHTLLFEAVVGDEAVFDVGAYDIAEAAAEILVAGIGEE